MPEIDVASAASPDAIAFGIEPLSRVATDRQRAPVSGVARCGWPFEITRTAMSMSAGASCCPESVIMATGGATNAMPGPLIVPAVSRSGAMPMATDAARRIASSLAIS